MTSTRKAKHHTLKRVIALALALLFLLGSVPSFAFNTSASSGTGNRDLPDIDETTRMAGVTWVLFNIFGLPMGPVPIPILPDETLKYLLSDKSFIREVEEAAEPFFPPGVKFVYDGKQFIVKYNSVRDIRIGNYIFDRYVFGTKIDYRDFIKWNDYWNQYNINNTSNCRQHYVPFIIYDGKMYIETITGIGNTPAVRDIFGLSGGYMYYFTILSATISLPVLPLDEHWTIEQGDYYGTYVTSTRNENLGLSNIPTAGNRQWLDVRQYAFNAQQGLFPFGGAVKTFEQITAGATPTEIENNLGSFYPRSGQTGVLVVPPTFYAQTGMTFMKYLETLNIDEIFERQPPTLETNNFPVPPELQDPEFGDGGNGGNGGGGTDLTGILGWLDRIYQMLEEIRNAIQLQMYYLNLYLQELPASLNNIGSLLGSILSEIKKVVSNTDGLNGGNGGNGGGSTIWDFLSSLIDLLSFFTNFFDYFLQDFSPPELDIGGELVSAIEIGKTNFWTKLKDLLLSVFVPRQEVIQDDVLALKQKYNEKFAFIPQTKSFIDDFIDLFNDSEDVLQDEIAFKSYIENVSNLDGFSSIVDDDHTNPDLPGYIVINIFGKHLIFDKNEYSVYPFVSTIMWPVYPYRFTIHLIILVFSYTTFSFSVLKRIPKLLGGIT